MFGWTTTRLLARARKAMRVRDWRTAEQAYARFVVRRPRHYGAWVQFGHALKEQGDFTAARTAYDRALGLNCNIADSWLQLGHVLKLLGDRTGAIDAYASAAAIDPGLTHAVAELIALGARDRLPDASRDKEEAGEGEGDHRATLIANLSDQADESHRPGVFNLSRFDAYRRQMVIPRPPRTETATGSIEVHIDARGALPAQVRSTLSSLLDQVDEEWRAVIHGRPDLQNHSVASLALLDDRIRFVDSDDDIAGYWGAGFVLLVTAGTVLDRYAIGWFAFAAQRTDCLAAYCDHDQSVEDWRQGLRFEQPTLHPMFDPDWFADRIATPAAVLVDSRRVAAPPDWGADGRRLTVLIAARGGGVAHIPLLLATIKGLAHAAATAFDDPANEQQTLKAAEPAPLAPPPAADPAVAERIAVIIQTRDEPQLLDRCVTSLRDKAAAPELLDIFIVDNRSVLPATQRLLKRLAAGGALIRPLDDPFNWSRANNVAVEETDAPLLLFLNNDTEMLSANWDVTLKTALADPGVGIVGAHLLYPDRTIQHAGIVFGMGSGGPLHEGVGRPGDDPGPTGRWVRSRSSAAVTGAFMAMRRQIFATVDGFDAVAFSVAFNDVDICLRVRAAGFRVVQVSQLVLVHYESKTRGTNITRSGIAWDFEELALLHRRWGATLFLDPGYNPHWSRHGLPFDGYRYPALREIVRHIDLSAKPNPWRASPGDMLREPEWW